MTVLNKQDIPRPALPKETVSVPELDGEVVVQAMLLTDQLDLSVNKDISTFGRISYMLAKCVRDGAGDPIFSIDEWEIWGSTNTDAALMLFGVAKRLSGMGGEEKKETAPS